MQALQPERTLVIVMRQTWSGYRDEANMVRPACGEGAVVHVVRRARPGTKKRCSVPQGLVQAYCRPSNSTMKFCQECFRILLHNAARQMLDSANTFVLMTDGIIMVSRLNRMTPAA
jgi:hypothetical protein